MAEHPELSAHERAGKPFPVSWDQFHRDCRALTWRLNEVGPFHAVIAITRGGLVPAAIVARELGVRVIDTVCIASYDHTKQGSLTVLKGISAAEREEIFASIELPVTILWFPEAKATNHSHQQSARKLLLRERPRRKDAALRTLRERRLGPRHGDPLPDVRREVNPQETLTPVPLP